MWASLVGNIAGAAHCPFVAWADSLSRQRCAFAPISGVCPACHACRLLPAAKYHYCHRARCVAGSYPVAVPCSSIVQSLKVVPASCGRVYKPILPCCCAVSLFRHNAHSRRCCNNGKYVRYHRRISFEGICGKLHPIRCLISSAPRSVDVFAFLMRRPHLVCVALSHCAPPPPAFVA